MRSSTNCVVCGDPLASQREKDLRICFVCRRYGLLHGEVESVSADSIVPASRGDDSGDASAAADADSP